MDYYNVHLRKTSDPTPITKQKLERGMVVKLKYKKDKQTKLYIVFILQPKWPNSIDGKLHGLSMANIPPNKMLEIAEIYNEVVSSSKKVKRLDIAKIKIDEASKLFYTSEIKTEKKLKAGYRTFNLKQIQSIQAVNYDWGKYDKVPPQSERRIIEEQKKREAEERLRNSE
jgi:hypothetical protein